MEAYLGKQINRLNPDRPFSHYLQIYNGVLPDARTRWCTRNLKIKPFERYVGTDECFSYIGIRADELHRKGYISSKSNIHPRYPFIENGITKTDVIRILDTSGLGFPKYYDWRSRSGCYFCFFQQRIEWVGLLENHPQKFNDAMEYEKMDEKSGERFSWSSNESLQELMQPDRINQIKDEYLKRKTRLETKHKPNEPLMNIFIEQNFDDVDDSSCLICHL